MVQNEIWRQGLYLAPYNYIIDATIVEYDIEKANINVLHSKGAINKFVYNELLEMPKQDREVTIGKMIARDHDLYTTLSEGIMEARKSLCEQLKLSSESILAIKNDAVFVIYHGLIPPIKDVYVNDLVKFRPKNQYRSFYRVFQKEIYYNYDMFTGKDGMDVKGLGEYGTKMCGSFIALLCNLFRYILNSGPKLALYWANDYYRKYINKELPMDIYRRFDSHAMYDIVDISSYCRFQADYLPTESMYAIDTSYNGSILRLILSYISDEYLKRAING